MNKLLTPLFAMLVACATTTVHAQPVQGNAQAGERKNAMCIGCHGIVGYQASFPEVYKVPKISGQSEQYIVAALTGYQKGERKHPSMRAIAQSLNAQDIADLAAYYSRHGVVAAQTGAPAAALSAPPAVVAQLLQKGACVSCHGANLNQPIDPAYPKIAGQYADASFVALKSYKTDNQATWGRANPIMGGIAKQFSNAELKVLANYLASLPGDLKTLPQSPLR